MHRNNVLCKMNNLWQWEKPKWRELNGKSIIQRFWWQWPSRIGIIPDTTTMKMMKSLSSVHNPPKIPPVEKKKPSRRFFFRHKMTSIIINSWLNGGTGQLNNSKNGRLYRLHIESNLVQNAPKFKLNTTLPKYLHKSGILWCD